MKRSGQDGNKSLPDQQWKDVELLLVLYGEWGLDVQLQETNMACTQTAGTKDKFLKVHFLLKKEVTVLETLGYWQFY